MAIDPNSPEAKSAKAQVVADLVEVGLPASLADELWGKNYLLDDHPAQYVIEVDLPQTEAFKTKFPAFSHFQQATGGTVKDYISLTNSYGGALKAAGLPSTFYDSPDDYAKWINGDVSPKEVSDRIDLASKASLTAPPEVRDFLVKEGLSPTDLAAYFLDPDKGDLVQAKARYTTAEIGGAAKHAGFDLSVDQATGLQAGGTTGQDATQGFSQAAAMKPLFTATAAEATTGTGVGVTDVVGAVGNDPAAQAKIARAKEARAAEFGGGGGAGAGGKGDTGLGGAGG